MQLYVLFVARTKQLCTSSGKFLRVESCHPESSDFLGLCIYHIIIFDYKNVQAEFLLFECLQDITGGELLFVLGMQVKKISVKRLIYFKIIQDKPGKHSKHDNYNGKHLNQA